MLHFSVSNIIGGAAILLLYAPIAQDKLVTSFLFGSLHCICHPNNKNSCKYKNKDKNLPVFTGSFSFGSIVKLSWDFEGEH